LVNFRNLNQERKVSCSSIFNGQNIKEVEKKAEKHMYDSTRDTEKALDKFKINILKDLQE